MNLDLYYKSSGVHETQNNTWDYDLHRAKNNNNNKMPGGLEMVVPKTGWQRLHLEKFYQVSKQALGNRRYQKDLVLRRDGWAYGPNSAT